MQAASRRRRFAVTTRRAPATRIPQAKALRDRLRALEVKFRQAMAVQERELAQVRRRPGPPRLLPAFLVMRRCAPDCALSSPRPRGHANHKIV